MVRLRLRRVGRKKQPSYRIVAAEKESPRDGRFLEVVGFYNPRTQPETITLEEERIYHWLSNGAQPSDSTARIFNTSGLMARFERFKAGEDIAKLVEESQAWQTANNLTVQTRTEIPESSKKKAKEAAKAEAEAAAAPAEEKVEEAPAEAEAEVEEAPAEKATAEAEEMTEEAPAEEAKAEEAPAEVEAEEPQAEETPAEEVKADEEAPAEEEAQEEAEDEEESEE
jgi:small subunit ribosomal protein S16